MSLYPICTSPTNRVFNMIKGLNIRIYPNVRQTKVIERTFGCTRFVYNKVLGMKKELWEDYKLSFNPKIKSLKEEWKCKNYTEKKLKIAKLHEYIKNQRKDFQHKVSSRITDETKSLLVKI